MPAIISDQFRILNAETFVKSFVGVGSTVNKYYSFIGLPNSTDTKSGGTTDWNTNTPAPLDGFKEESEIKESIIAMKKITDKDVRRLVRKVSWVAGTTYEMYRHDYSIYNLTPTTSQANLYEANFYVINEDLRVYVCLQNGSDPENPKGRPSYDQPTFIDLESRAAGTSGDGYIWKYLYTIKPSEIVKFDSIEYIPVPENWGNEGESVSTKANSIDGKVEIVVINDRGSSYQPISTSFANVPILGDGSGGTATITIDSFGKVSEVFVTDGGQGYTHGNIQFFPGAPGSESGGVLENLTNTGIGTTARAVFDVIMPPKGGHGYDVYRELGAYRCLLYSRFETQTTNPDVIEGNDFSRIGVLKNPTIFGSDTELLDSSIVSGLRALKLTGLTTETTYAVDSQITQTVGVGSTAVGFVASWDSITGVLKYFQPMGLASSESGFKIIPFTSTPDAGYGVTISGASVTGPVLSLNTDFNGITTSINNTTYQLGINFVAGIASAEYNTKSGELIYIDNRVAIPRSSSQKEDIKIVLEF
tara:strand:- start:18810 stop:20405 length:1596 start_codon:yes stop_codon:yes gene_type:complete